MLNHKEYASAEFQRWFAGFLGDRLTVKEQETTVLTACNIFLPSEVLLYNTPRKVVVSNDGSALRCPNCGLDMMGGVYGEAYNFELGEDRINNCWDCGQKLDWEVDEDV